MRIFTFLFIITSLFANAQTVSNITTAQIGDKIEIRYNIDNSTKDQLMNITVSCLVNNTSKIELKQVTGDVGNNIAGGKSQYVVVWDVLQEVDELNSAEFFIKVAVQNTTETVNTSGAAAHPWYVAYNAGLGYTPVGLRIGYEKDWGFYGAFRAGLGTSDYGFGYEDVSLISATAGVSKRLIQQNNTRVSLYAGIGAAIWGEYDVIVIDQFGNTYEAVNDDDAGVEFEVGGLIRYKRVVFGLGMAITSGEYSTNGDFTLGVGVTF